MTRYRYRAISSSGDVVEDEINAEGEEIVVRQLQTSGMLPMRICAADAGLLHRRSLPRRSHWNRVAGREVAILTRQIALLLQAGLPVDRSLEIAAELSEQSHTRRMIARVLDRVRGGATLGDALATQANAFPRLLIGLARAGEAAGKLDAALFHAADHLERELALGQRIRSALIYPAVVMGLAGVCLVIMFTVVLPAFDPVFEGAREELPAITQAVMIVGEIMRTHGWAILVGLAAIGILAAWQGQRPPVRVRLDAVVLRLPVVGKLAAELNVARISHTLATLLANGVALVPALGIAKEVTANAVMARVLDDSVRDVKEGQPLSGPLNRSGIFPPVAVHLIRVGEEAGRLDDMLFKVAELLDRHTQLATERLIALLVPAITIVLGVMVGAIIASILLAILSVYELAV
ncbi:MAG TPA: type II secretion system F family protein [Alphaproteobacteria bacterium]|nr:type II secretion system F family protein [Alphaproteobacteria bacterium]